MAHRTGMLWEHKRCQGLQAACLPSVAVSRAFQREGIGCRTLLLHRLMASGRREKQNNRAGRAHASENAVQYAAVMLCSNHSRAMLLPRLRQRRWPLSQPRAAGGGTRGGARASGRESSRWSSSAPRRRPHSVSGHAWRCIRGGRSHGAKAAVEQQQTQQAVPRVPAGALVRGRAPAAVPLRRSTRPHHLQAVAQVVGIACGRGKERHAT